MLGDRTPIRILAATERFELNRPVGLMERRTDHLVMRDADSQHRMAFANFGQRRPERGRIDRSLDLCTQAEVYGVDLCVKMEETLGATKGPEQTSDIIPHGRKFVRFSRHAGLPGLTTR